jgi:predicted O-methyltransferase YrrM
MSRRTKALSEKVRDYILNVGVTEPPVMRQLRTVTRKLPMGGMQISPEQGQFMGFLVRMLGAKRCLEVGTFTGYSALAVANALPADGMLICCDVNVEWTDIARRFWGKAGVASRIELRLGPAVDTLDALIKGGAAGSFDFAFIDADKTNYGAYYERCLTLLRPGGVLGVDNALWSGRVADSAVKDKDTVAIRKLNKKIHGDKRVDHCLLPIGDGLMLARKKN